MKKLLVCLTAACLLFASCTPVPDPDNKNTTNNTETNDQTSDQQGDKGENTPEETPQITSDELPEGFTLEGKDGATFFYSAKNKTITLSETEASEYTLSGDFEGQIVVKADDTIINLNNANLSNTDAPVIISDFKFEVSAKKGSTNTINTTGNINSENKIGAITGEKRIKIGGGGTLDISCSVYHGIKSEKTVEIKGSGTFTVSGTMDGSAINCDNFEVETDRTFTLNLKDSKNGIKADESINIESGTFNLSNISKTGFKTDTKKDDAKKEGYDPEKPIIHKIHISSDAKVEYGDVPKKADSETVDIPAES